jgi:hypothetical protein
MPIARRRFPFLAFWPDSDLVQEGPKRDQLMWLRTLAIRNGQLTYDIIIDAALRSRTSPFYDLLSQDDASLIHRARKQLLVQKLRLILITISCGTLEGQKHRALVSVLVGGQRQIVPTPWVARQPNMVREITARAVSFRDAWERHRVNILVLQRMPVTVRWWKVAP